MARSIYFSEQVRSEQSLYEDIVIEALKIYGYDMYYLPRDIVNRNDLLNEDVSSRFNSAYMIEMYVDNIEGFDGQGDIFQKFGVEIRDNVTLTMSRRRWNQAIKRHDNELTSERPLEGDLVYVPFSRKLFQIMRVEHEQPFYQVTNLPTYKLYCELFEFAGDDFDTGVAVVDEIERSYAYKYILSIADDGNNATGVATLDDTNGVAVVNLTNRGSGYASAPTVTFSAPTQAARTGAITVFTDSNTITSVEIVDSGNFYLDYQDVINLNGQIIPATEFAKFGNNSLRHDSAGARTIAATVVTNVQGDSEFSTLNNRSVIRLFYWAESSGQAYNSLYGTPVAQVYHRTSDNKLVYTDGTVEVVSSQTLKVYDSAADSGFWNYLDIHTLNDKIKININGESGEIQSLSAIPTISVGDVVYLGAPAGAELNDSVTQSFKGYLDHFVSIRSEDTEFRFANPIPVNTTQMQRDEDTLKLSEFELTFDNIAPVLSANLTRGRISSVTVEEAGSGLRNASYVLTIPAPSGTAANFTATGEAIILNGVVADINVLFGGSGYATPPTVTISPVGSNVTFEPGDKVYQTLSDGTVVEAEVAKYTDSDYKIHVINLQSSDGKYHDFVTGLLVHKDSANGNISVNIASIEQDNQLSQNEQNDAFSTEVADFLDFTETNPFGDPENN